MDKFGGRGILVLAGIMFVGCMQLNTGGTVTVQMYSNM